ncbi:MAG TPA: hypothetical protein VFI96_09100 [Longimicrobiaceae bacterium]|nr:hypothetical protein [Longimicrobiaceae bacterium]
MKEPIMPTRPAPTDGELKRELRDFASARPDGWNHQDWLNFLEELRARGHNINDREEIGRLLERERLGLALEKVKGMGPQRISRLAARFGQLWRLREASTDEVAEAGNLPRSLAERVKEAVGR